MSKYYAYIPDSNGNEPIGTFGRIFFTAKTTNVSRLKKMTIERLGKDKSYRLYSYTDLYRVSTFKLIHEEIYK